MLISTCDYFHFLSSLVLQGKNDSPTKKLNFQRYASNNLHKPDKCAPCQDIFLNIPQVNNLLYSSIHCNNLFFRGVVVFHKEITTYSTS